ncbi:GntR family transcriptional regulator [Nocardia sp. NBC_01327]|uniref:GntR family transcriptional regulator n=1 Tax=Nocardia sp. NBC_01327 TaxID=2903593 RepID=UPI002E0E5DBC|nr:GntR family transcriptional regulator [Nocardia sp. NBC_01327]
MAKAKSAGSRADMVTAAIRADILDGHLAPGQRLTFPELGARHGVSVGVLREALARLVEQGIVKTVSNLGFSVIPLSARDFAELTQVRTLIEPQFFRQSVLAGSMRWESEVVAAHHLLQRTPYFAEDGSSFSPAWNTVHTDFHMTLLSGCTNVYMHDGTARLRDVSALYRRWSPLRSPVDEVLERGALEHRALVDAALAHDADRAEQLLREHIQRAADEMVIVTESGEQRSAAHG